MKAKASLTLCSTAILSACGVLFTLGVSSTARADAGDITVHVASVHIPEDHKLNGLTPGVAYDVLDHLRVGVARNSYRRMSVYAAGLIPLTARVRVGLGAVTGYSAHRVDGSLTVTGGTMHDVVPLVAIEVDVTKHASLMWFGDAINLEVKF